MKALISPNESNRIVELSLVPFEVALPLHWVDCPVDITTEWAYFGGVFEPPVVLPVVTLIPTSVTMRQARLALLQAGLLASVNTAIASLPEPQKSYSTIEWEYATEVLRESPLINNLASGLSLSTTQLDDLFTLASSL